jgi:hypothetical protein
MDSPVLNVDINAAVYNNDKKQILLVMSHIEGGSASPWKIMEMMRLKALTPPWETFADFLTNLRASFVSADLVETARKEIGEMRQGRRTVVEYITEFRIQKGQSGMTEDISLVEFFSRGLNNDIYKHMQMLETIPTTLENYMTKAQEIDGRK